MIKSKITAGLALLAIAALAVPSMAFASPQIESKTEVKKSGVNEFGIKIKEGKSNNGKHLGQLKNGNNRGGVNKDSVKGTITAVKDTSIKLLTSTGNTITVNMDDTTKVNEEKLETGAKVKITGFWDSVLNIFNAFKIKIS
jgi:hypothetical protein